MNINIPNVLTLIRILLTPLFIIFMLKNMQTMALVTFSIAGVSDGLDGFIARYFNQKTELGAVLDPVADKLLITAAYVSLAIMDLVPESLTVIVLSRDIIIALGIAIFTMSQKDYTVKPRMSSKLTTVAQLAAIFVTLLNTGPGSWLYVKMTIYWITAGLTIVSGFHYIYIGLNILQEQPHDNLTINEMKRDVDTKKQR